MKVRLKPQNWYTYWYEADPARLALEKQAMETRFPRFSLRMLDDKSLAWFGTLESNRGNRYEIAVVYPPGFPRQAPEVFPINPAIEVIDANGQRLKHQYPDGHLCLYYPNDRTFHTNTTVATVIAVAAAWFFAFETWLESGKKTWPGPEAD